MVADETKDLDAEINKVCGTSQCGICLVPLKDRETSEKHYSGKIHSKKLERWKEQYISKYRPAATEGYEDTDDKKISIKKENKLGQLRREIAMEEAKEKPRSEEIIDDIFLLAKKAREAIYLRKGEAPVVNQLIKRKLEPADSESETSDDSERERKKKKKEKKKKKKHHRRHSSDDEEEDNSESSSAKKSAKKSKKKTRENASSTEREEGELVEVKKEKKKKKKKDRSRSRESSAATGHHHNDKKSHRSAEKDGYYRGRGNEDSRTSKSRHAAADDDDDFYGHSKSRGRDDRYEDDWKNGGKRHYDDDTYKKSGKEIKKEKDKYKDRDYDRQSRDRDYDRRSRDRDYDQRGKDRDYDTRGKGRDYDRRSRDREYDQRGKDRDYDDRRSRDRDYEKRGGKDRDYDRQSNKDLNYDQRGGRGDRDYDRRSRDRDHDQRGKDRDYNDRRSRDRDSRSTRDRDLKSERSSYYEDRSSRARSRDRSRRDPTPDRDRRDRPRDRSRPRRDRSKDRAADRRRTSRDRVEVKREKSESKEDEKTVIKKEKTEDNPFNGDGIDPEFNDLYADTSAAPPMKKEKLDIKEEEAASEANADETTVKTEKEAEEDDQFVMPTAIDPKLINSMDPSTIMKMLAGNAVSKMVDGEASDKKEDTTSAEAKPDEVKTEESKDNGEKVKKEDGDDNGDEEDAEDEEEEEEVDPLDMSIPTDTKKLMRRCFNPVTGIGYCPYCNKIFINGKEANKHFFGNKHANKVKIYQDLLLSEAAILQGSAPPAPSGHSQFYCELCESNCSGQKQLDQHLSGEKHRTFVRRMENELAGDPELDKDINPYNLPEVWLRERKHCNLCDVPIESIRLAKIHFNSKLHRDAAGLNVLPHHKEAKWMSVGDHYCDVCNFRTQDETGMKSHKAGIRHLENDRTKTAVIKKGLVWRFYNPIPPRTPKYSVRSQELPPELGGGLYGMPGGHQPPTSVPAGGAGWGPGGQPTGNLGHQQWNGGARGGFRPPQMGGGPRPWQQPGGGPPRGGMGGVGGGMMMRGGMRPQQPGGMMGSYQEGNNMMGGPHFEGGGGHMMGNNGAANGGGAMRGGGPMMMRGHGGPPMMGGPAARGGMMRPQVGGGPMGPMGPMGAQSGNMGLMGGTMGVGGGPMGMQGPPQHHGGGGPAMMGGPRGGVGGPRGMMGQMRPLGAPMGHMGGGGPMGLPGGAPQMAQPSRIMGPNGGGGMQQDNTPQGPIGPNALMKNFGGGEKAEEKENFCSICQLQLEDQIAYDQHLRSEEHAIAEANVETYRCRLCKVNLTTTDEFNGHLESPDHIRAQALKNERDAMRMAGHPIPDSDNSDNEEDQFLPEPIPLEGTKIRSKMNPWHCGLCNLWFPSITILKFYHSLSGEHCNIGKSVESTGTVTCLVCKVAAPTVDEMWEKCTSKQRQRIIGPNRSFSCEMCDVHLSDQEWLDNHNGGEKHRWVADRIEKLLPVQFPPVEPFPIQKEGYDPYTGAPTYWQEFRCVVCKVNFCPIDKFRKHVNSLFHAKKCAGEDVKWIDNGQNLY